MSPEVISLIGIIIGLVVLVVLAFKGLNIIVVSLLASVIVALFSGSSEILPFITDSFMTGFSNFAKNNYMIFLLSAIFGKLMGDCGAADAIAFNIMKLLDHVHNPRLKQLAGGLSITLIVAVLTYSGISLFVVVFTLIGIARPLFKELNIPWRYYLVFHGIGSGTFTMSDLPGSASTQNLVPTQYLGTTAMAGAPIGITSTILQIICSVTFTVFLLKWARKRNEGFLPSGELIEEAYKDEDAEKALREKEAQNQLHIGLAVLPCIVLLVVMNVVGMHAIIALTSAIVVILVLFGLIMHRLDNVKAAFATGAVNSITSVGMTCGVVGFGSVVAAVSGYQLVLDSLTSVPGAPIFKLWLAGNIAAGITGSSSGGYAIMIENMKDYFFGLGLSPEILHRVGLMASAGMDSMPHTSGFVNNLQVCKLNHKQSYPAYFVISGVIPVCTSFICCVLLQVGILPGL